jgi:phage terminase large subunit-like protein
MEYLYRKKRDPLSFFDPLPMQQKFFDDPCKMKLLAGGNRSGKSNAGAPYVLKRCIEKPKQKWWVSGTTYADSRDIQQRKIYEYLPKHLIKYGTYSEANGYTNRKIILKNSSEISFKSFDQGRDSYQGEDCDGAWFDEEAPIDIFKEQRLRLLDRNGEFLMTMTPLKGMSQLMNDVLEGYTAVEIRHAPLVNKTLPIIAENKGWKLYFLWTTDNPYIDKDRLIQEVKYMSDIELMSRIYGIPTDVAGRVYPMFSRTVHVIDYSHVPEKNNTLYTVLDPHDRKPWAIQWWVVNKSGSAYLVDEYPDRPFDDIPYDDKTYDDYAELIKERERYLKNDLNAKDVRRLIDPNFGRKTVKLSVREGVDSSTTPIRELSRRGLYFKDAFDSIDAGHLAVKEALRFVVKGELITVQPQIYFCSHCKNTIEHMSKYSFKSPETRDGDMRDRTILIEKYKDFCDCVRYFWTSTPKYVEPANYRQDEGERVY